MNTCICIGRTYLQHYNTSTLSASYFFISCFLLLMFNMLARVSSGEVRWTGYVLKSFSSYFLFIWSWNRWHNLQLQIIKRSETGNRIINQYENSWFLRMTYFGRHRLCRTKPNPSSCVPFMWTVTVHWICSPVMYSTEKPKASNCLLF